MKTPKATESAAVSVEVEDDPELQDRIEKEVARIREEHRFRKETAEILNRAGAHQQAEAEKALAHRRGRPARWAALPPLHRALVITADENGDFSGLGKALLRIAELLEDETAALSPPRSFEPEPGW